MDRFTADLRQLDKLNPDLLDFRPVTAAPRQQLGPFERASLKSALSLGKGIDSKLGLMADVLNIGDSPPVVSVLRPASTPVGVTISKSTHLTVAFGIAASAFAFWGGLASAGFYGSTTREVGAFFTHGIGIFFPSIGASAGGELTFILGTPSDFKGPYWSAGVSVAPAILGVGAQLLFLPGFPLVFMGVSVSLSANTPSELPVTFVMEITDTSTKPLLRF
jgi:hypothetical protein